MRILVVLCLALASVAAQGEELSITSAPEGTLSCVRKAFWASIDASKENTEIFLQQLSPKEDISDVLSQVTAEYVLLKEKLDNSTKVILRDRDTCEENNKQAIFSRNCGLLARLSFVQKSTRHVMAFSKNTISIITKAHLNFATGRVLLNIMHFLRGQSTTVLGSLRAGVACFRNRN